MKVMNFNTGIPDFQSVLIVDGIGVCQLRSFYENGDVLLYVGNNRMFRVSGKSNWRYANFK